MGGGIGEEMGGEMGGGDWGGGQTGAENKNAPGWNGIFPFWVGMKKPLISD